MNNWVFLLQWMLAVAMLRMSYEMSTPAAQTNPSSVAARPKQLEKSAQRPDGRSERVKRFARLPPATQEKVLAYGENLLKYLEEDVQSSGA